MRVSTRGRYALRAMMQLALDEHDGPVKLMQIAARQGVSVDYLEQLLRRLRKAGLARSVRGPRGGYRLARSSEAISVWEILAAVEQDVAPVHCVDELAGRRASRKPCPRRNGCPARDIWAGLSQVIQEYLRGRSLRELAAKHDKAGAMFEI